MSSFFLDLRDKVRVIDFLADNLEYASSDHRSEAEKWIHMYEEGETVHTDKLAEAARAFAWSIWPARYAVKKFLTGEGSEEEWETILAVVRPSTAHILKRFRADTESKALDDVLAHVEADVAFRDGDRVEIDEIRKHVRQEIWKKRQDALKLYVKEGEKECAAYREKLKKLRDLAIDLPRSLQDEAMSKIEKYEDRILFEGAVVPLEIFDQEVTYYIEQKEISPLEG